LRFFPLQQAFLQASSRSLYVPAEPTAGSRGKVLLPSFGPSPSPGDIHKLWDVKNGSELQTLTGHFHSVQFVAFSSDGSTLASGSSDDTIKLWDVKTGSELQTLTGHSDSVLSVAHFSPPDGHHIPVSHNNCNSTRFDLNH
jgi:WD40 repeat protein